MKKNKFLTVLMAVTLLSGTGTAVSQMSTQPVMAASKKGSKVALISARNAALYQVRFNKSLTKVAKVVAVKKGKHRLAINANKAPVYFSFKYKGVKYYFLGHNVNAAIRASQARRMNKKAIPTYRKSKLYKAIRRSVNYAAKKQEWKAKLQAAMPKTYTGKTNDNSVYYSVSNNKLNAAKDTLAIGTPLTVVYSLSLNNNASLYYAVVNGKTVFIPAEKVTLDDASAKVLTFSEFKQAEKNYENVRAQARKELGVSAK